LPVWNKKTLKSFLVPGGALLLLVVALESLGWLTLAPPALSFLCYCGLLGGMLLAWRFHSSRIFYCLFVLFLSLQAIVGFESGQHSMGPAAVAAVRALAILVPINFVLISWMQERGFTVASATPVCLLLFVESVVVVVLGRSAGAVPHLPVHPHHVAAASSLLPGYALFAFAVASVSLLLLRFLITRKLADSALIWSLAAFFLCLRSAGTTNVVLYLATAACILSISIVENSYLLAYHDELTALPSRRAFNDALLRLQAPFSIAVVDIDHFKKFNDTYGHETGDQVLRLVASRLSSVTGGGQAYRCGGEEFTILFSGKTTPEVVEHLERLRVAIEKSEFHTRGGDRRQIQRGPDRRNERAPNRPKKKGHAIRQLAQEKSPSSLSVTVSIGVANSHSNRLEPELVQQSADKALYRAKANGRNRLETATSQRRSKEKAAGIA
jgi:diguanylate cyclase (GGDEF)-like protein